MMSMNSLPLYEKIVEKPKRCRVYACLHLLLMLSFLGYRVLNPLHESYNIWIVAFACEIWFAFQWILEWNMRWLFVDYKTYPDRLAQRYSGESAAKLPPVDIIITTADPLKEPPIITANTVLSVLAIDYPLAIPEICMLYLRRWCFYYHVLLSGRNSETCQTMGTVLQEVRYRAKGAIYVFLQTKSPT